MAWLRSHFSRKLILWSFCFQDDNFERVRDRELRNLMSDSGAEPYSWTTSHATTTHYVQLSILWRVWFWFRMNVADMFNTYKDSLNFLVMQYLFIQKEKTFFIWWIIFLDKSLGQNSKLTKVWFGSQKCLFGYFVLAYSSNLGICGCPRTSWKTTWVLMSWITFMLSKIV